MRNPERWIDSLFGHWSLGCTCPLCVLYGLARQRPRESRDRRAEGILRGMAAYQEIVHQPVVQTELFTADPRD